MIIKIPKKIRILTHTYTIRFASKDLISYGSSGLTKHLHQEILLEPHHAKSEIDQTFLHELIHVIERHLTIKIDDPDVDRLAEGLALFLFDSLGIELDWSNIGEVEDG